MTDFDPTCISCRTLAGDTPPPGGVLLQTPSWSFFLHPQPPLVPGQGFIVLNRHCERLSDLTPAESAELGVVMQTVNDAMMAALSPVRVHFGLYAEGVKHMHLHVLPRVASLPAGNIPIVFLSVWYQVLTRLRLRQPYDTNTIEDVASQLRPLLADRP